MSHRIRSFVCEDDGATAIEYVLMASMSALVLLGGYGALGDALLSMYTYVESTINTAMSPPPPPPPP